MLAYLVKGNVTKSAVIDTVGDGDCTRLQPR